MSKNGKVTAVKAGTATISWIRKGKSYDFPLKVVKHTYVKVVTPPTCTEGGYTTYTCACGHSYVDDQTEATGHTYEAVVTPPTWAERGYTTYTCACGDSYIGDIVPAWNEYDYSDNDSSTDDGRVDEEVPTEDVPEWPGNDGGSENDDAWQDKQDEMNSVQGDAIEE